MTLTNTCSMKKYKFQKNLKNPLHIKSLNFYIVLRATDDNSEINFPYLPKLKLKLKFTYMCFEKDKGKKWKK